MKVLRPWNLVWATLFVLGCLVILMPTNASAAKIPTGPDNPSSYGAWGNDPRQGASNGITIAPFNDKQPEMTSFACIVGGRPVSQSVISTLQEIGTMGLVINQGAIDEYSFGGRAENQESLALWGATNYGFPDGIEGVRAFIAKEKDYLNKPLIELGTAYDDGDKIKDAPAEVGFPKLRDDSIADDAADGAGFAITESNGAALGSPAAMGAAAAVGIVAGLADTPERSDEFEKALNNLSAWSRHENRQFQGSSDDNDTASKQDDKKVMHRMPWKSEGAASVWLQLDKAGVRRSHTLPEVMAGFPLTKKEASLAASLLKSNPEAPAAIFVDKMPDGCIPAVFDGGLETEFGDLLSDPQDFIASILLSPVIDISNSIYQATHTDAWSGLFMTAHTERGDLIWDIDDRCLGSKKYIASRDGNDQGWTNIRNNSETCQNNKPLGFSKANTKENVKDRPIFLDLANLIAWLITGTYFVILFAAAVLFIYRGNKSQKFNLMKVAPRIFLSMIVAVAAPFLIGALITLGNWTTVGIFDLMDSAGSPINSMNLMLSQAGAMMGVNNELAEQAIQAAVAVITMSVTIVFLLGTVVKQLAMIFLIVTAPIAIFCLIVDSWRPKFMRWLKALMILVFIPVVMAVILQLGVLLNPLMSGAVSQALAVFMLLMTIMAMGWVMQKGVSIAIRGKNTNVLSGILQGSGMITQKAGSLATRAGVPWLGGALGVAGQGMRGAGGALNKGDLGDKLAGKLIPEGRAAGGAGAGAHAMMKGVRGITQGWHIGQGRRGIAGRAGSMGYGGSRHGRFGGGGGRGRGQKEDPGFIKRNTFGRMSRSLDALKLRRATRKTDRREDRALHGRLHSWQSGNRLQRGVASVFGSRSMAERLQNTNIPDYLKYGKRDEDTGQIIPGTAADHTATLTGAKAERKYKAIKRERASFESETVFGVKNTIRKLAEGAGSEQERKALRKLARQTDSMDSAMNLANRDLSGVSDEMAERIRRIGKQSGLDDQKFYTDAMNKHGVVAHESAMKRSGNSIIFTTTKAGADRLNSQENSDYGPHP